MSKPRRLFFDIETSPNLALIWRPGYKVSVSYDNIVRERAIICVAWKWEGEREIKSLTWDKKQNDAELLRKFVPIMYEADELVAHNGDRFDTPWIRTRCLKHGIEISPDFVSLDTLKLARSKFYFNSNRLDYIAQFLGLGKKRATGYDLWKSVVMDKDEVALDKMVAYCKNDVRILSRVWNKFMPYVPAKSSVARERVDCPECGSKNTAVSKQRVSAAGQRKTQMRCSDCGKYNTIPTSALHRARGI
jgi:DNA polymerase elongation subunit (family B)